MIDKRSWHRSCYGETCHNTKLEHSRLPQKKAVAQNSSAALIQTKGCPSGKQYTQSSDYFTEPSTV